MGFPRKIVIIFTGMTLAAYFGVSWWYDHIEQQMSLAVKDIDRSVMEQPETAAVLPVVEKEKSYDIIVHRNIFQADEQAGDAGQVQAEFDNLDETSLQLVLLGTVAGTESVARAIIIDEKNKKQDLYRIGDSVQGAKIIKISRRKVVLDVQGEFQVLTIRDRKGGGPAPDLVNTQIAPQAPAVRKNIPVAQPRRRISLREPIRNEPPEEAVPEDIQEPEVPLSEEEIDDEEAVDTTLQDNDA